MSMDWMFLMLLFTTAFLYSSIGHGGASGYLALMALFGMEVIFMRSSALVLNLFVSALAFISYYKAGYFKLNILLPFVLGSMPAAFFGSKVAIDPTIYKLSLGICLLITVIRMVLKPNRQSAEETNTPKFFLAIVVGILVGFFSGMIGIGGGIILSPVLLLLKWTNVKESAAISAAFIWLNSLTGLMGAIYSGVILPDSYWLWVCVGAIGGLLGSWTGSYKIPVRRLSYILASVLLLASFKLIFF